MKRTLTIALLIVSGVHAAPAPRQRYEVSSVTACPPATAAQTGEKFTLGAIRPAGIRIERTRVVFMCMTPESLIHMAYNGGQYSHPNAARRDVVGGPEWIRSEHYTIEGSAAGAENPDLRGAMLRSFLEERFQLRVRRRVDDAPVYALKVARGGLKIQPLAASECQDGSCSTYNASMNGTIRRWDLAPASMKTLADLFDLDRQVIDKTGVKERFVIHLELETAPSDSPVDATIRALEQQLGLTLVPATGKRSWVQIERIERPRETAPLWPAHFDF